MPKQLTVEEIESVKKDMKKIYEEAKLEETLYDKLIELDIQKLNNMLTWTEAFEKNPTLDTMCEFVNFFANRVKNSQQYKAIGCSDEDIQTLRSLKDKIAENPVLKSIRAQLFAAADQCKKEELNSDNIFKAITSLQHLESFFDDPLTSSEENKALAAEIRILNQGFKDENIIKMLMSQERMPSLLERAKQFEQEALSFNFEESDLITTMEFMTKKLEELESIENELAPIRKGIEASKKLNESFSKLKFFQSQETNVKPANETEKSVIDQNVKPSM